MVFSNNLLLGAVSAAAGGYLIEQSLLFDGTSAYLSRTPSTAGNRKTWTFDCWVKQAAQSGALMIISASNGTTFEGNGIRINSSGNLEVYQYVSGAYVWQLYSDAVFRDFGGFFHLAVLIDTTEVTQSDRVKIYVNGVQLSLTAQASGWPSQNSDTFYNSVQVHEIGKQTGSAGYF